jgi:hypothetical protein
MAPLRPVTPEIGLARRLVTTSLGPQRESGRRAVATFPVKPCGLPGRLGLGTYPRFRIASGPFPADDQVLRVTGTPSLPREAS